MVILACASLSAAPVSREYQLKAVFLFNFAQFAEWPATAFPDPAAPLVIGVLGQDPFGAALDETVKGETVAGRPLAVRRYTQIEDVERCHVLFVSSSETSRLPRILAQLKERPVLTVGETEEFIRRGGMIGFVRENNRIRLRINLEPVRSAQLVLSSKLLRPAEVLSGQEDTP